MIMFLINLSIPRKCLKNFVHQNIDNWHSTTTNYGTCRVISGRKIKLRYLVNKAMQHNGIKEFVLQF